MNSIFFRIYGGLLAALVLTAALGALALHITNEVRAEQYRERLASGTFHLMSSHLETLDAVERKRSIALWSRLLGVPLRIQSIHSLALDGRDRSHILRGKVLVRHSESAASKI